MISLVAMTEENFQRYCHSAINNYAEEHIRGGRWSREEAHSQAQREYQQLLPDGVATANHYLYTLQEQHTGEAVGMIWFAVRDQANQKVAFIYDVEIEPAFRRKGYATQAFQAIEAQAHALGLSAIQLHVFGHNHEALALYEKLGFIPTNIMMSKQLGAAP